ncbi:ROK family protein [Paenibacillus beijingensis]|uniref:Glucokinase n=1 Tax=Paenibacillus beijingensis TaxID=1126833 RepID=A0A0D5NDY4_9BACL|nr:ROK family protein [Paenibacillus beijingensis]AJY73461.1 hypothetical protein VN24_01010 [Paenibacillus beijingensis]
MKEIYLGIDLGGTKMLAALVDPEGRVIDHMQAATLADQGSERVISRLIALAEALIDKHSDEGGSKLRICGIGIAVAGILDPQEGTVLLATNLGWRDVPVGRMLEQRFSCPVQVLNDANAAALGEWMAGAGAGTKNMVFVTVSTGIGGGIISEGKLLLGASNSAAELGHISIDRNGPLCACGNRGCVEVYASGTWIAGRVQDDIARGSRLPEAVVAAAGGDPDRISAKHVTAAAQDGNEYAKQKLADAGAALGAGLVTFIHLLNPEMIVLGGGVSESGPLLFDSMLQVVREYGIPGMVDNVRFTGAGLGLFAGAVGAALWWKYAALSRAVQTC